jgi:hypothetical protein
VAEGSGRKDEGRPEGVARFEGLTMNVVPSSITKEASEAPRRAGWRWLLLVVVLVGVFLLGYAGRKMLNVAPGREAEQRLRARLQTMSVFQLGQVLEVRYLAGDRLRVDLAPSLDADTSTLRKVTIEVMKAFMVERPNRDLYIDGYEGERQVVWGEYHSKGGLQVAGGGVEPNITVRVAGEPEGGIGELVKPRGSEPR